MLLSHGRFRECRAQPPNGLQRLFRRTSTKQGRLDRPSSLRLPETAPIELIYTPALGIHHLCTSGSAYDRTIQSLSAGDDDLREIGDAASEKFGSADI